MLVSDEVLWSLMRPMKVLVKFIDVDAMAAVGGGGGRSLGFMNW